MAISSSLLRTSLTMTVGAILVSATPLPAQVDTGTILGTVTDASRAIIRDASVTLTNEGTNANSTTTAGLDGTYKFTPVRIGSYKVSVSSPGFQTTTQHNVTVNVGADVVVDFTLKPGLVAETVDVTTATPVLGTQNASVGQVVDSRSVLHGRYFSNRNTERDLQTAVGYFKKAIEKEPDYALAYIGLAKAYFDLPNPRMPDQHSPVETLPLAKAAVSKALELDPSLGEAHVALAWSLLQDWDWSAAEKEARLALTLNPNYADAHQMYSEYLSATGRNDEAIAHMNYAIQLDPLNSDYKNALGWTAYRARQYDLAINQFKIKGDDFGLALAYLAEKMYREAIEVAQESIRQSGRDAHHVGLLALAYGSAGRKHDAQKLIDELNEMSHHSYVAPATFVGAYIGLGDHDKALTWLERGYEEHGQSLYKIKVAPIFDPLRSEPRFQAVLRRMNFPQ